MGHVEGLGQAVGHVCCGPRAEGAVAADPRREGLALDVVHDEVGAPVLLADLVDADQVGVAEASGGPSLELEALEGVAPSQVA